MSQHIKNTVDYLKLEIELKEKVIRLLEEIKSDITNSMKEANIRTNGIYPLTNADSFGFRLNDHQVSFVLLDVIRFMKEDNIDPYKLSDAQIKTVLETIIYKQINVFNV